MSKTHMKLSDRIKIQSGLEKKESFKRIAEEINKDCTTVSREIKNHIIVERKGSIGRSFNDCQHREKCSVRYEYCTNEKCKKLSCRYCRTFCMTTLCKSYVKRKCQKLDKPPYVCNGCSQRYICPLEKHFYIAETAQKDYKKVLSESRSGFAISEEEVTKLGTLLSNGFRKGQSIFHIIHSVGEEVIGYSAKTIYTYVDSGVFKGIGNIDLPRKVRYKARKKSYQQSVKKDKTCRIGRTYADFILFLKNHPDTLIVEMDTVEGKKGMDEKCLLIIHFTNCRLMLAFIRDCNSAASVVEVFRSLREKLGNETYARIFPLLLTDNGSEFTDQLPIEMDSSSGQLLSAVFYCEPRQSQQKGSCENNHEFIRRIIPRGKSMNNYSQEKINLMMSHINSYLRAELGGHSPYDVFSFMYGPNILDKLNIRRIDPSEVTLKPSLLD